MTTLADKAILSSADNRPPMLEKDMYDSWKSKMEPVIEENGVTRPRKYSQLTHAEAIQADSDVKATMEENGVTRPRKYLQLTHTEAIQVDSDVKATNIILQCLPLEVYALPGNINGWVDDDDVEEEDEENEDADIEEDDDAEIIFPYEVQGDQNPPPRDESSDFDSEPEPEAEEADDEPEADDELEVEEAGVEPEAEGADVELEAEEPDGVPEATIRTGSQRPFAVRDFPMDFYETGESYTTRDPQFVGGLAPWALRRDLEALIIEGSGLEPGFELIVALKVTKCAVVVWP
nr:hypothetical protein [Tanacetum cinerariifolium]